MIPVYNEKRTINEILEIIRGVDLGGIEKEIIIVDDGSTDGTRDLLTEIAKKHDNIHLHFHEKNMGKGGAIRTAVGLITGDVAIIQDADLEYDPNEYMQILEPILSGKADVVFGSRFQGGRSHRVLYYWHSVGNYIVTLFANMVSNLNLTDMECCYKAFRREVIQSIPIKSNDFGIEPELVIRLARKGVVIYETPVSYYGRTYEEGKKITWVDGFRALKVIAMTWYDGE